MPKENEKKILKEFFFQYYIEGIIGSFYIEAYSYEEALEKRNKMTINDMILLEREQTPPDWEL